MKDFAGLTAFLCAADAGALLEKAAELSAAIAELAPMVGFDQHSPHHAYDLYTHTVLVTAALPAEPVLRWAGLLHDVGKVDTFTRDETGRGHFRGHAQASARRADAILQRLGAPRELCRQVVTLISHHMTRLDEDESLLARLGRETALQLICLQQADIISKGTGEQPDLSQFTRLRERINKEEVL